MSEDASHSGSSEAHAHDDARSHEEPPPPPEPKTPMWLPALGVALFVSVALWWAVTPKAPVVSADAAAAGSDTPAAVQPQPQGQAQAQRAPAPNPGASAPSVRTADGGIDNAALQRILDRLPK